MINHDEVMKEFLVESHENLDRLDQDFLKLEAEPSNAECLGAIFRTIHTIKGTSGFLGLSRLEALTHAGENLLSRLRDGKLVLRPDITSALLALVDVVRGILRHLEATAREPDHDHGPLIVRLTALCDPAQDAAGDEIPTLPAPGAIASMVIAADESPAVVEAAVPPASAAPPAPLTARAAPSDEPEAAAPPEAGSGASLTENYIRVGVGLLDNLMNLVGELVLARNQILQCSARIEDAAFVSTSQRLNLITTELQAEVMKTRMQPIGNVWNKLPRVVRDLSVACGKQVRVEMAGKETELDRTVLEAIKDPLTHLVRNAVDHGIEAPDIRSSAGKPRTGTLQLRAYHEGGQVNIEISDDGRGMDVARIRAKAVENGVVAAERAAQLNDRELLQLVFLPGFSTAAQVTNVSGRGVGMDVVKTNIEKIGGTVDLQTDSGRGSTIRIKIPLTLAIVPALLVASGANRYAIPQASLLELVRLEGEQAKNAVLRVGAASLYRLRGTLLPLVHLNEALDAPVSGQGADTGLNVVVLQADERQFGLVVDEVRDTEEIVVKPLGKEHLGNPAFAGATIMGDGRVALILDVMGLAQHAHVVNAARERALIEQPAAYSAMAADAGRRQTMLLFRSGAAGVMALPLSDVARLEEFSRSRIESSGTRRVVQYRGDILPLLDLSEVLYGSRTDDDDQLQVVVHNEDGCSVGIVVGGILDIVEEVVEVSRRTGRPGVLGAAVIQGRVTDLIDIQDIVRRSAMGRAA